MASLELGTIFLTTRRQFYIQQPLKNTVVFYTTSTQKHKFLNWKLKHKPIFNYTRCRILKFRKWFILIFTHFFCNFDQHAYTWTCRKREHKTKFSFNQLYAFEHELIWDIVVILLVLGNYYFGTLVRQDFHLLLCHHQKAVAWSGKNQ